MIKTAIITISDKGAEGSREDKSGRVIEKMLSEFKAQKVYYNIIPDEVELIEKELKKICDKGNVDLIFTTGGTGFAPRDVTPEATLKVIEKEVPGIPEMMRAETISITPMAALSRARSGIRKNTLIINLPGSTKAVRECLDAIREVIPHGIDILKGNVTEH
ncbi:MAG: MogA/MoaB family molybdenum cofactor biosynthesis protein [Halanaerobiales bacterium]